MKRFLSLCLVFCLLGSCFSLNASAKNNNHGNNGDHNNKDEIYEEAEPNNSYELSDWIFEDCKISGEVSSTTDIDCFKFRLDNIYYVSLNCTPKVATPDLKVYFNNEDGDILKVATADEENSNYTITGYYMPAGTYFVSLLGLSAPIEYEFSFSTAPARLENEYNWMLIDGYWYCFDINGILITSDWAKDDIGWCYLGSDGRKVFDKWVHDGIGWAFVNVDGHKATNCWIKDTVGWCYLGADGYCSKGGWLLNGGFWYYLDSHGRRVHNRWMNDGTGWYFMGENGYMLTNTWVWDLIGWR